MSVENILKRIRGLRALSQSSNQQEAETAARMAAELIQKHRIDECEVDIDCGRTEAFVDAEEPLDSFGRNIPGWRRDLACVIASECGCAIYSSRTSSGVSFRLAGRPSDILTARYLYAWLSADISRMAAPYREKRSYCLGAVYGVDKALQRGRATVEAGHNQAALVLSSREEDVRAWLRTAKDMGSKPNKGRKPSPVDPSAFGDGFRHGTNVHLGKALDVATATRALPETHSVTADR